MGNGIDMRNARRSGGWAVAALSVTLGTALVLVLGLSLLSAQTASKPARNESDTGITFTADTRLVVLHTTVQDKKNHLVTDLPQESFRVYEDDVLQRLTLFRREDVPVSLGILVDNSGSMIDKRRKVNAAALSFVKASNPQDEVFIVNFNDEAFLDAPFTADLPRLQDGLQRIDSRGGTALYEAVTMSLDYMEEEAQRDKRVLLVISDGEDNASRSNLEALVRRLQASEERTVIYAIGLLSEEDRRSAKRASRAIGHIVKATGGAVFFPASVDEVGAITQRVAHDIRNQYTLAYSPSNPGGQGFHRVKVVLAGKAKKYTARHRPGYFTQ